VIASRITGYPEPQTGTVPFVIPEFSLSDQIVHVRQWLRFESPSPPPLPPRESFAILRI
jgi:hypothetical protein